MGTPEQPQESVEQQPAAGLLWARNESNFDVSAVKPHKCMDNIVQRGNYIHCFTGNHGMRIPAGKILTKDAAGNWALADMVVFDVDETGQVINR